MKRVTKTNGTAFRQWMHANNQTPAAIAAEVGCTEGSIRHYMFGRAIPKPGTLRALSRRTGLPAEAFLFPFEGASA